MDNEGRWKRYARQILIEGFGPEGQAKLNQTRVVIVGCGGLGSVNAMYLAAAGIGTLRIIDRDTVELSNLNRQLLHWDRDIGASKVVSATGKLAQLNPEVQIEPVCAEVTPENALRLLSGCDVIVDALDSLPARLVINHAAMAGHIPLMHGAVHSFEGRVMTVLPGSSACLRCIYHVDIPPRTTPVLGATAGVVGTLQATEVLKYLLGMGKLLTDTLLVYDGLKMEFTRMKVRKDPACEHCGRYEEAGQR